MKKQRVLGFPLVLLYLVLKLFFFSVQLCSTGDVEMFIREGDQKEYFFRNHLTASPLFDIR